MLQTLTNDELAERLGLKPSGDNRAPSPWGVARLIRREVRRRGLATRRELKNRVEPMLGASGFDTDAFDDSIRDVAERMVAVGELAEVRVENQRGYAASPSRWIELSEQDAVLLGVVGAERLDFRSRHPAQFLRRFHPSDTFAKEFDRSGVKRQPFADWFGPPSWLQLVRTEQTLHRLEDLWNWHVSQVRERGVSLEVHETNVLAIATRPGDYFGRPERSEKSRWTKPSDLQDGCYLGAQPGYHERQWHPLIIEKTGVKARSLLLGEGLDSGKRHDLLHWLLLARAESTGVREQIMVDIESGKTALTCPIPRQLARTFDLIGEPSGAWKYSIPMVGAMIRLIGNTVTGIEFKLH